MDQRWLGTELERRLAQSREAAGVLGASVAVVADAGDVVACSGQTSTRSPHPVLPETKFRTGSICKVYTAALLMELLHERGLSADEKVVDLLPEFRVASGAGDDIRIWHLLSHTSGLNTDFWDDSFGHDDDAIRRYVAELANVELMFRPGATFAYSNSGFVVAGRVVEHLAQAPFQAALGAFLAQHALCETEIVHGPTPDGYANGHYQESSGLREATAVEESRALMPAGTGLFASPRDVARFARLLIRPGSPLQGAEAMRAARVVMPAAGRDEPTHHGLGWKIYDWPKGLLVGHNGNGTGQFAWVRADVRSGTAVAVMVNTIPGGGSVWRELSPLIWDVLEAQPNEPVKPRDGTPPKADWLCGTYRMSGASFDVTTDDQELTIVMRAFDDEPTEITARYADPGRYATGAGLAVTFEAIGNDLFLHYGPLTARRDI